jgi:hypothetical protein
LLDLPVRQALKERERRGKLILKLDDAVSAAVEKLKARANQSVPEAVRRRARELHAVLEGDVVRLRRDAREDRRQRAQV